MPFKTNLCTATLPAVLSVGTLVISPAAFAASSATAGDHHVQHSGLDAEAGGTNDDYGLTASDRAHDDSTVGGETMPRGEMDAEAGGANDDYGLSASERDNDDPSFSDGAQSRDRQYPDDRGNVSVDSMSNRGDSLPNDNDLSQADR